MKGSLVGRESITPPDQALWDLEGLAGKGLIESMSHQFKPVQGFRVAEVGAGIGTFTSTIPKGGALEVVALEPDPDCLEMLRHSFDSDERTRESGLWARRCRVPGSSRRPASSWSSFRASSSTSTTTRAPLPGWSRRPPLEGRSLSRCRRSRPSPEVSTEALDTYDATDPQTSASFLSNWVSRS